MSRARELDQFYTSPLIAKMLFDQLLQRSEIPANALFLEPSAGEGAFYVLMPEGRRLGLDLEPKHPEVRTQDFFTFEPPENAAPIVTVGNPPFGKNSSLAVRFFNHAATFSQVIAMVVPMTFRKDSLVRRLDAHFEKVSDDVLPKDSFVFHNEPYDVPCCFQVWVRREEVRVRELSALTHSDFDFVTPEEADFAFRRVGGLAGKLIEDFKDYAQASHYYLKAAEGVSKEQLMATLRSIDWREAKANNAGNPSISKRELVAAYAKALG